MDPPQRAHFIEPPAERICRAVSAGPCGGIGPSRACRFGSPRCWWKQRERPAPPRRRSVDICISPPSRGWIAVSPWPLYTGWWLLGILCELSMNPDSCILRSAESFRRHGRFLLVLAKFVPGISSLAPPLAGSMNMRFVQFLLFDAGSCLTWKRRALYECV